MAELAIRLLLGIPAALSGLLLVALLCGGLRIRSPRLRAALHLLAAAEVLLVATGLPSLSFLYLSFTADAARLAVVPPPAAAAVLAAWGVGAGLLVARRLRRHRRLGRLLRGIAVLEPAPAPLLAEVAAAARAMGVAPPPTAVLPGDSGPFTTGVRRPVLAVGGERFADLGAPARRAILLHEMAHLARRDGLRTLLVGIVGDLFFANVFFRRLLAGYGRECEALADRAALRCGADGSALARQIAAAGAAPAGLAAGLGVESGRSIRRRVALLQRPVRRPTVLLQAALLLLLLPFHPPGAGGCRLRRLPEGHPVAGRIEIGAQLGAPFLREAIVRLGDPLSSRLP